MNKVSDLKMSADPVRNDDPLHKLIDALRSLFNAAKTAGAGAACFIEIGTNREGLFSRIDSYLYKAESIGKNTICRSSSQVF